MFKQLLAVQWKTTRSAVFLATVVGFMIPIASVRRLATLPSYRITASGIVLEMQGFGTAYALLAAGVGLTFAMFAWSLDHRGRHVYALSLPIERSKYAAMRFGAGVLFLLLPAIAVLVGSLIGLSVTHLPPGLHGYPIALTLRFLLASAVAYAVFFAISAATPRTAGMVLGTIASVLLLAFVLDLTMKFDLLSNVGTVLFSSPGLLAVFTGRWMLIDV
jgi:hypothetical protein